MDHGEDLGLKRYGARVLSEAEGSARDDSFFQQVSLAEGVDRDVRPWLELAEELATLNLEHQGISIPQIVVMGDQSSGKSSVLEALSGVPFPRGSGLVTRCPTRLAMRKASDQMTWQALVHTTRNPADSMTADTPAELASLIERLTDDLTEGPSGFSADSIVVKLTSPDAPDLTVVDLPGIVRTTTKGQRSEVIAEVNNLIRTYLFMERTIILAVIPANQDIATVDILERASAADPNGVRTLGVLTKPDLISPGAEPEVVAVLRNLRKPLKLGYIMVKNRSQREIAEGGVLDREAEAAFFRDHPAFNAPDLRNRLGVANLTCALTKLLAVRIQQELEPMSKQVDRALHKVRVELESFPSPVIADLRPKLLVGLTQDYLRHLNDGARGEYRDRLVVTRPELRLYTRALDHVFNNLRAELKAASPDFKDARFVINLATQMEQLRGRELPGFMNAQTFHMFLQELVDAWKGPAKRAVAAMRTLSLEVATQLARTVAANYPKLADELVGVITGILDGSEAACMSSVSALLSRESDPFTLNDFLQAHVNKLRHDRFAKAVSEAFSKAKSLPEKDSWFTAKEAIENSLREWYQRSHGVNSEASAQDMTAILEAYWTLAAKRFTDNCCMCLDEHLMSTLVAKMTEPCYALVHDDDKLDALFEEDPGLAQRRREALKRQERLLEASKLMTTIQVDTEVGPSRKLATARLEIGSLGLGLQLSEESGRVVVKGFRAMADPSIPNPCRVGGVMPGDIIDQVNGEPVRSFQGGIALLKSLHAYSEAKLTLIRQV